MERLLLKSKCFIFHDVFKTIQSSDLGFPNNFMKVVFSQKLCPKCVVLKDNGLSYQTMHALIRTTIKFRKTSDKNYYFRAADKLHISISIMPISPPHPMFSQLLESSHRDNSNKCSNIGFLKK